MTSVSAPHPYAHAGPIGGVARFGLAARATVYLIMGVLAVMLAAGRSTSETDQRGALQQLNRTSGGHMVLWITAAGLAAYSLWRSSEVAFGTASDGAKAGPRLKSLARAIVYGVLSASAFEIALGNRTSSQAGQQETWSARVMRHSGGRWAVGTIGAIIVVVGLALLAEGLTRKFERNLDMSAATARAKRVVTALGVIGTSARGVVFALAGVFVIQAAVEYKPQKASGLDGALRSLKDTAAGPWLLGLVALGLVAFGLYGYAEARWTRT